MKPVRLTLAGNTLEIVADRRGDPADPSVVLLHGGGQTRHSWSNTAEALAENGWCTYTPDARGHGESGWSTTGDYTLGAFAADLVCLLDQLTPANEQRPRPVIVGASLGGLAAILAIGRDRPDLARALVLADIVPRLQRDGADRIGAFMVANMEGGFGSLEEAARAVADYSPGRQKKSTPEGLRRNLRERDGRWYWHWDPAFIAETFGDHRSSVADSEMLMACARRIEVPILVIRGRMSDVITEQAARQFVAEVPNAEFVDLAGAAHMVAGDRNDAFTSEVTGFLAGLA